MIRIYRMSLFFFRLHTVRACRRAEGRPRKKFRTPTSLMVGCAGTLPMRRPNSNVNNSSMFERPPVTPSDSLDEVAFKIPRLVQYLLFYLFIYLLLLLLLLLLLYA
ncbi:hypothetical protein O3M35_002134 [Rhynocoris fuscipes]|uniref:Uncharacterized protein n=1 Tax=Rhynocoris fuscipes TaxID=488301 RepID=A0AAW1CRQ9_9HEMI